VDTRFRGYDGKGWGEDVDTRLRGYDEKGWGEDVDARLRRVTALGWRVFVRHSRVGGSPGRRVVRQGVGYLLSRV